MDMFDADSLPISLTTQTPLARTTQGLFVLELQLVEEPINPVDPNGPAVWFPAFVGVDGPPGEWFVC